MKEEKKKQKPIGKRILSIIGTTGHQSHLLFVWVIQFVSVVSSLSLVITSVFYAYYHQYIDAAWCFGLSVGLIGLCILTDHYSNDNQPGGHPNV